MSKLDAWILCCGHAIWKMVTNWQVSAASAPVFELRHREDPHNFIVWLVTSRVRKPNGNNSLVCISVSVLSASIRIRKTTYQTNLRALKLSGSPKSPVHTTRIDQYKAREIETRNRAPDARREETVTLSEWQIEVDVRERSLLIPLMIPRSHQHQRVN